SIMAFPGSGLPNVEKTAGVLVRDHGGGFRRRGVRAGGPRIDTSASQSGPAGYVKMIARIEDGAKLAGWPRSASPANYLQSLPRQTLVSSSCPGTVLATRAPVPSYRS